ncbi:hypothetical protein L596_014505 [Steinernema carpocapsae]|uniref:Uncharacterized protein n=1 Tax=Steinernema carpocapsae TaxID=34508 RepID=A0A4U5ND73_STECR|nr:hypothetical protein L596_014505 [Steinernema carpocapsae]
MLRLRIFPVILPFLFLVTIPRTQQTAEHPNVTTKNFENPFRCFNDSSFHERTRKFLEEFVRNRAKPHISMLQKLNNQINGEIDYYVEHLKWSTIQRMTKENPKFTIRGSVEFHFADFAQVIRKFIFLQSDIGEVQIKRQIHRSLRDFLIHVFPSAFLCLPMGSCKSPSANYINCLSRNANTWQKTFFDIDSDAIANEITVSIKRYRKVQRSSDEAYAVLLQASENLDENCLEEFAEFRFCETAVFCPDLCVRRARECFRLIGEKWAKKLFELKMLAKNFGEEFKKVENDMLGIFFSHHLLQPTTVAELAFKKCGSLRQTREEGANEAYVIPNREKPKAFHKGTEHMVEKLIGASIDLWNRASTAVCPLKLAPQQECFNGTQFIVPSLQSAPRSDSLVFNPRLEPRKTAVPLVYFGRVSAEIRTTLADLWRSD